MKSKDAALIPMLELTLNQLDHYGSRYEPAQAKAMVASCLTGNQYMRGYIENTKTCKDWQFAYEQQLRAIEVFHSKRTSGKPNKRPEEQVKHEKTAEILKDANIEMRLKRSADTKDYDELKIPQVAVKTDGIRNFGEAMRTLDQVVAFLGTFPVSEQERDIIESKFSSLRALWGKAGEEFMVVKEQSVDKGKGKTMDEAGDGLKPGSLDTSAAAGRIQHIVGEMKGMTLQIKSQQVQEQQDDDWIEVKHEEDDKGMI